MMKKERLANIELLRVVSMMMVVTLHSLSESGILFRSSELSAPWLLWWTLEGISVVAVNCYVLISGYFLICSRFRVKKLLILLGECVFYSVFLYISGVLFKINAFSIIGFFKSLTPVISNEYWFVTTYVALYILAPVLNIGIRSLGRVKHLTAVVLMMVLCSVYPNLVFWGNGFQVNSGYSLIWFICLYVLAAWVRLYYSPSQKTGKYLCGYLVVALCVPASKFLIVLLSNGSLEGDIFYSYNSILVWPAALLLFLTFLNMRFPRGKISNFICKIAPNTFAVYLIYQNDFVRAWLWKILD